MNRRTLALLTASTLATVTRISWARDANSTGSNDQLQSGSSGDALGAALQRYLALPGTKSYLIHAGPGGSLGQLAYHPNRFLFTASAYKTFVLGQYLCDVEAGLLSEDEQLVIDDSVRMISSPVFFKLAGTTQARSVLDAMIAYSDNTATDLATGKVGADRVRALLAQLGLSSIRIPDSTRRFFSYLLGAPAGVDLGWPGVEETAQNLPGILQPPLNAVITLAGSVRDFVSWYEQALQGTVFSKPETLRAFKRFQSESDTDSADNTAGYARLRKRRGIPCASRFHAQRQEFCGADGRQQWRRAGSGNVWFCRELGWAEREFPRSRGRVLRGDPEHPDDHQAGSAMTEAKHDIRREAILQKDALVLD